LFLRWLNGPPFCLAARLKNKKPANVETLAGSGLWKKPSRLFYGHGAE
jgi:hypothetical protein